LLRSLEVKHLQLTGNARRTPSRNFGGDSADEFAQFFADVFSSSAIPMPPEPRPIYPESCLVSANNGIRLNENECRFHPGQSRRKITQNARAEKS